MRIITLLFCISFLFGQSNSPTPAPKAQPSSSLPDQKSQSNEGTGARGRQLGALDILSDTQGVDFGPYLQRIVQEVRYHWYLIIPESVGTRKGKLAIEFTITKGGKVADMRLVASSGDVALDRPAGGEYYSFRPVSPAAQRVYRALSGAALPLLLQPRQQ